MNTMDVLNRFLYPNAGDNTRRKSYEYFDTQTFVSNQLDYYFFNTPLGNQFLRNKKFPLAGTEVFFIQGISMQVLSSNFSRGAVDLIELLQKSFLEISIDNRVQCKLPGLDILKYNYGSFFTATGNAFINNEYLNYRKLPVPILINSTSAYQFKFTTTAVASGDLEGSQFKLILHGTQLDKLDSFYWDQLKNNKFQQNSVTYYDTQEITTANETTYEIFSNPAQANNLISKVFPNSEIQTFSLQNIEVLVGYNTGAPGDNQNTYYSRLSNILNIFNDDVVFYNSNLHEKLSMLHYLQTTLTTTPDTTVDILTSVRNSKTLPVPLEFPANGKTRVQLIQPSGSVPNANAFITVVFRGVETRRVA